MCYELLCVSVKLFLHEFITQSSVEAGLYYSVVGGSKFTLLINEIEIRTVR